MHAAIRDEAPQDVAAIRRVHDAAFGRPHEARLVERLRANGGVRSSLVAIVGGRLVGHILFSPVCLGAPPDQAEGAGLGPMAVLPELQRAGVGSKLVAEGIDRLRQGGCPFVVVLGHPAYYSRFGFVPASRHGVRCQWDVPDEAFMLLSMGAVAAGEVRYRDEFAAVEPH